MSFTSTNYSLAQQQELEAVQGHQMIPLPSAILFTCLAPLTVLGNGLLLLIFTKNTVSLLRAPSNFFIFSMAFANFLTGAVLQPLLAYRYYSASASADDIKESNVGLFHRYNERVYN